MQNDPLEDVPFKQREGKVAKIGDLIGYELGKTTEPEVGVGGIVYTSADTSATGARNQLAHVQVRATVDETDPAMYLSKLGYDGEVVLASFEEMSKYYPVSVACEVSDISMVDYPG